MYEQFDAARFADHFTINRKCWQSGSADTNTLLGIPMLAFGLGDTHDQLAIATAFFAENYIDHLVLIVDEDVKK